ncbi:hypothetical protein [Haliangium sp.]|uniref:hypothetical protein n=1 Tax=Haliangium sp. TaxID=2663208 RepID=UPI003D136FBB
MKKGLFAFLLVLVAGVWGCAQLDLDADQAELETELMAEESFSEGAVDQVEAAAEHEFAGVASEVGTEAEHEFASGAESEFGTEVKLTCEGQRCGSSCGFGYVCDPFGKCVLGNPGCD